jgi:predicted metalloprotease
MGGGGAPIGILFWLFSRFGLPGVLIGGVALYFLSGGLGGRGGGSSGGGGPGSNSLSSDERKTQDESVQFVSWVFDDVQKTWAERFKKSGQPYRRARMELFTGAIDSACGMGQRAMGPFYFPGDQNV